MASIKELRTQYPMYSDLSDVQLADAFHTKFYSDIPKTDFYSKLGLNVPSEARTVLDQTMQGVPLIGTFTDEITDGIGAAGAGLLNGVNPIDLYKDARAGTQQRLKSEMDNNPTLSIGSQLAGGLIGGVSGASTKTGQAIINSMGRGGLLANTAKGIGYGASSGAVTGFGAADDGSGPEGALSGGLLGGAIGGAIPGITQAGTSVINAAKPVVKNATQTIGNVASGAKSSILGSQLEDQVVPSTIDQIKLGAQKGNILPLTIGERTGQQAQQSLESTAAKGGLGDTSRFLMQGFRDKQQEAAANTLKTLQTTRSSATDSASAATNIKNVISGEAAKLKGSVNAAYQQARESGKNLSIDANSIRNDLTGRLSEIAKEYDVGTMPKAKSILSTIDIRGKDITAVKLKALENWRTRATNAAYGSQDASEGSFLKKSVAAYDQFMEELGDTALINGDDSAIDAFKKARNLRAEYGRRFENDKMFVDKIINDKGLTNEQVANTIFGRGKVGGNDKAASLVDELTKAAGLENAQSIQDDIAAGVYSRLYQRSLSGQEFDGVPQISFTKLQTEVENLLENKSLTSKVFKPDEVETLNALKSDLTKINSRRPGVDNTSNTAEKILFLMNRFQIGKIPFLAEGVQSVRNAHSANQIKKAISKPLNELQKSSGTKVYGQPLTVEVTPLGEQQ